MASQALAAPLQGLQAFIEPKAPAVLVINSDRECSAHCARMLEELNYDYGCVATAREALERLTRDSAIQILMVDLHIPETDGFILIDEARSRLGTARPLAAVMITNQLTTDVAVRGLHVEAVDVLCRPLQFDAYSAALRRAMRYLGVRRQLADGASMTNFSEQLARLVSVLESKTLEPRSDTRLTDKEIGATLRAIIASRSLRNRFFPSQMFADPAWDILLDLTRAKLDGQQVSVSSVCIAASVPMSTALRWVRQMTDAGLLRRWTDPKDRRRDLIALTEATATNMRDYLTAVHATLAKLL
jgi:DNA-binding response OmpR family regulator